MALIPGRGCSSVTESTGAPRDSRAVLFFFVDRTVDHVVVVGHNDGRKVDVPVHAQQQEAFTPT